jgi:transposase
MRLHRPRDDQWDRIKDDLPGRAGSVGVTAADNRRFVDAVLYRYRTGIPWRDSRIALATGITPTGDPAVGPDAACGPESSPF